MSLIEEMTMEPRDRRERNEQLVAAALAGEEWAPVGKVTWDEMARRLADGEAAVVAVDVWMPEGGGVGSIQVFVERSLR